VTARIRRVAAGWLLTLTLTLIAPAPLSRCVPIPPGFSAHAVTHEQELLATSDDGDAWPVSGAVDPGRWSGVRLWVRVSYEQTELLSWDQAQG
jgi:hypothetical protein